MAAEMMSRMLDPIRRAIKMLAAKGVVEIVDDSGGMQVVRVAIGSGELLDDVERPQPFGLSAVPESGDEAVILLVGGDREQAVAIVVDSSARRPTDLAAGEVCVYRNAGNRVYLKANGDVDVECDGAVNVKAAGSILLGSAASNGVMLDTIITKFNSHVHNDPVSGVSGPPNPPNQYSSLDATTKTKAE